ncbi:hypothetical protein [Gymnodinialimonas mytili]|uniref:hypothetical protein n=1 Tax=Gymnodinialimonas mytili TaxID=3126503 RepID=UPI0030EE8B86
MNFLILQIGDYAFLIYLEYSAKANADFRLSRRHTWRRSTTGRERETCAFIMTAIAM